MPPSRILFIDAYDSFSNNITTLLKDNLPVTVESIHIDDLRFVFNDDAFQNFLNKFDAVVAGPGPGHPANREDVGLIAKLWDLPEGRVLPVLGICLGFQSLALAHGGYVERLREPRHGLVTPLTRAAGSFFGLETGEQRVTQYHSLHARLSDMPIAMDSDMLNLWDARGELCPTAWDLSDSRNGPILMAITHRSKPFCGVQYHPESICSTGGSDLVRNWWREVCQWSLQNPRKSEVCRFDSGRASFDDFVEPNQEQELAAVDRKPTRSVKWQSIPIPEDMDVASLVDLLRIHEDSQPVVLESGVRDGKPLNPETGRFSVVGIPSKAALQCQWSVATNQLQITAEGVTTESRQATFEEVLGKIDGLIEQHKACDGPVEVPFWGGLVGFLSYEAGLTSINVAPSGADAKRPDVWFIMVEQSIVIDHVKNLAYIQSLRDDDEEWAAQISNLIQNILPPVLQASSKTTAASASPSQLIDGPKAENYIEKVKACQAHLRAGSSYELCLTDQTLVSSGADPWNIYKTLRRVNPAPFGAYLHFGGAMDNGIDIVSSSPERFLSWSRDGQCQFRPIKGTVKKTPGVTRVHAEKLLNTEKERAENLMIVDLIRHDLSGVAGVDGVLVPKLMSVEEYETVYQLVSVIEGKVGATGRCIDALARSLPPGSMTGAPKKRSCELLTDVEGGKARGLYSGVLGYFDVGGGADFSVVIRTAFKWDDEDVWRVGAGGAVTALSQPQAEFEEMLAKRESVLGVLLSSM
ncbi:para-aminobenzoate synthase [Hortaea werneckii]|nr:para-aminobenzoate synthase [Hortaea werneckii]